MKAKCKQFWSDNGPEILGAIIGLIIALIICAVLNRYFPFEAFHQAL